MLRMSARGCVYSVNGWRHSPDGSLRQTLDDRAWETVVPYQRAQCRDYTSDTALDLRPTLLLLTLEQARQPHLRRSLASGVLEMLNRSVKCGNIYSGALYFVCRDTVPRLCNFSKNTPLVYLCVYLLFNQNSLFRNSADLFRRQE